MDTASKPADVVRGLWEAMQARDWAGAAELVDEDVVVEWPVSRERMTGRENYISVNHEYPEGWEIRVLRVIGDGQPGGLRGRGPARDDGRVPGGVVLDRVRGPGHARHRVLDRLRRR